MDDTQQIPTVNTPIADNQSADLSQQTQSSSQDDQQNQGQQPAMPVGSGHKEIGPALSTQIEYVMPSEPREVMPDIDAEVKEAGVEHSVDPEKLELTEEHKEAGIELAKESVPVQTQPTDVLQVKNAPFTQQEAIEILKTSKSDDTQHWLATLLVMVIKKLHMQESQLKEDVVEKHLN